MSDPQARQVRLAATPTTIAALRRRRAPADLGRTRIAPVEFRTYRVAARLVAFKREADSDIHLVIADPKTGRHDDRRVPADDVRRPRHDGRSGEDGRRSRGARQEV